MKKANSNVKKLKNEDSLKQKAKVEAIKKNVVDLNEYFKDFDLNDFDISNEELKKDLDAFVPKPIVRTLAELKAEANKKIMEGMKEMKFGFIERDDFFLDSNVELEPFRGQVDKAVIKRALFDFAFICGNYNNSRKWIRFDQGLYFCIPLLLEKGNHAALVTFFSEKISGKLQAGLENAITTVLKKKGFTIVHASSCFSKGHLICSADNRISVLNDLKVIFQEMGKPQNDRDFSKVTFLAKKG